MKIALDLDGVVANIDSQLSYLLKTKLDIDLHPTKYTMMPLQDQLVKEYGIDPSWVRDEFMINTFWLNMQPYEEAWTLTNKWFGQMHDVYLITRRKLNAISLTERWLDEWEIGYTRLFCDEVKLEKYKTANRLGCDFFIEDNPEEVESLVKNFNGESFLIERPYNLGYDLPYIKSLWEIDALIGATVGS